MRCQCIICQEVFENKEDEVISVLQCGHTFHNTCVNRWLNRDLTCPSCRKAVDRTQVKRLYLSTADDEDIEEERRKIQVEINNLKTEIQGKEAEKDDIVKEKQAMAASLEQLEKDKRAVEQRLKQEQDERRIQSIQHQNTERITHAERQLLHATQRRVTQLQRCEQLINGSQADVAKIISTMGAGPNAVQNLSQQLAAVKRDHDHLKTQKEDLNSSLRVNETQYNEKVEALQKECSQLKVEKSQVEKRFREDTVHNKQKLCSIITRLKTDSVGLILEHNKLKENLEKIRIDDIKKNKMVDDLKREHKQLQLEKEVLNENYDKIKREADQASKMVETLNAECEQLKMEKKDMKDDVDGICLELEVQKKECQNLETEHPIMKNGYEIAQRNEAQRTKMLAALQNENQRLDRQVNRSDGNLEIKENELKFLRKTNQQLEKEKNELMKQKMESQLMKTETNTALEELKRECVEQTKRSCKVLKMIERMKKLKNGSLDEPNHCNAVQNVKRIAKRPLESSENSENEEQKSFKSMKMNSSADTPKTTPSGSDPQKSWIIPSLLHALSKSSSRSPSSNLQSTKLTVDPERVKLIDGQFAENSTYLLTDKNGKTQAFLYKKGALESTTI